MSLNQQQCIELVTRAITHSGELHKLPPSDWELLIRLSRKLKLLGRIAWIVDNSDQRSEIPSRAMNQLDSGLIQARKLQQATSWELDRVCWALQDTNITLVALKGVAYPLAGLPASGARAYIDLDVMVSEDELPVVESELLAQGWQHNQVSSYDEKYYRDWMHEIPALIHQERETEVDIHHAIVPKTSRLKCNSKLLLDESVPTSKRGLRVLNPVDMLIHCAVNLFNNNELADDLRDLLDIHDLVIHFSSKDTAFYSKLIARAKLLGTGRPLYYALHFSQKLFNTPIVDSVLQSVPNQPSGMTLKLMAFLVPRTLYPLHPDHPSRISILCRFLLYLRSHWLKMHMRELIPHLLYKSYLALGGGNTDG